MTEFFGLSMTYIMIALLCVLAIALGSVAWVFVRNRIIFMVGVRNIPRRRAQTTLIIVGLMLSTLIISTALSIGDTVDYSVTSAAYNNLHSIDEMVSVRSGSLPRETPPSGEEPQAEEEDTESEGADPFEGIGSIISPLPIPERQADGFVSSFLEIDGVDGAMKVMRSPIPVSNTAKGQTEPFALIVGVPADQLVGFESDFETLAGDRVTPDNLARDEIFASEEAADELAIEPGDRLTFFVAGEPQEFTAKAIVHDRVLTGVLGGQVFGFVLGLDRAQELFGREDEIDFIAISNTGGVRDSLDRSGDVTKSVNAELDGTPWIASKTKQDFVEIAAETGSFLTTIFVILGLFSIAAGMLLIFLIFVMLAAERKVEMGMVRAVGTKRLHLVQMFMSEGMVYNVTSAAIGCALGVGVAVVLVGALARLVAEFGLQVTFHVSPRSLIIAYSIGVVLTFLTVTFSSWRVGNLNITSAIRDLPDPQPLHGRPAFRGIGGVLRFVVWVLFKPERWGQVFVAIALIIGGGIAAAAGFGSFFAAAALYGDSSVGSAVGVFLGIVGGFVIAGGVAAVLVGLSSIFQFGPLFLLAAPPLLIYGYNTEMAFAFGAGMSLAIIGAALLIRFLGAPARPVFTTMGIVMLVFWLLFAGNNVPFLKALDGDFEMFFLSGVTMVIASTFVLVYNADLMLSVLTLVGGLVSTLVPSIRTAVAYPLANKFRTGMTIAMISLVMFSLVTFSTINANFDRIFLSDDALGGYEVIVSENPANPIDDLLALLDDDGFNTTGIAGVDEMLVANRQASEAMQLDEDPKRDGVDVYGLSPGLVQNNGLKFSQRAEGLDTDEAVWAAVAENPDFAIVDAFKIPDAGFGESFVLEDIKALDATFAPIPVEISNSATGEARTVQIVGVLSPAASGLYAGVFITEEVFDDVFARPDSTLHYVRLNAGTSANDTAKGIESTLLSQGVQADSLRKVVDDYSATSQGFSYLLQGFMGIGLFVGIAAIGVIAFRTVVERRQQIGMLRAIGYTRRAIALSFVMESSFTALLGILSGIVLGLLLANQLLASDDFRASGITSIYYPWLQIIGIALFSFIASLVMTIIPSRQASSIPIAEALRYE